MHHFFIGIIFSTIFSTFLTTINGNPQCYGFDNWHVDTLQNVTKFIAQVKNAETCIAIVKQPELSFNESRKFCEENFPSGELMNFENFMHLRSEYRNLSKFWTLNMQNESQIMHFQYEPPECRKLQFNATEISQVNMTLHDCAMIRSYVCQYPFQFNCAWRLQDVEIQDGEENDAQVRNEILFQQKSDFYHAKLCDSGTLPNPKEFAEDVKAALKLCHYPRFESEWLPWQPCSASCTVPNDTPPVQFRVRPISAKCLALSPSLSKNVALFDNQTCNTHIKCSGVEAQHELTSGSTTVQGSSTGLAIGIIICVLVALSVIGVVTVIIVRRRNRSPENEISKPTENQAKPVLGTKTVTKSSENFVGNSKSVVKQSQANFGKSIMGKKSQIIREKPNNETSKKTGKTKSFVAKGSLMQKKDGKDLNKTNESTFLSLPALSSKADIYTFQNKTTKKL